VVVACYRELAGQFELPGEQQVEMSVEAQAGGPGFMGQPPQGTQMPLHCRTEDLSCVQRPEAIQPPACRGFGALGNLSSVPGQHQQLKLSLAGIAIELVVRSDHDATRLGHHEPTVTEVALHG
jgi:hypothetical protein